ncbi:ZIP family metal transporter [Galbitalea soli]|uniref:ZIP family metal transporter n=1 Tax=Galbitalea soli TaxID=1268042 RepID=A0A7C9TNN0_9MICO|nr:ZIP family metal transporter [Galbitalea soli]NEM90095.1 ZIP family metal transporter [Galbitalea soli]NYJ30802.1 ZIP family zinc transporter [Galbitalea soli]
MPFAQLVVLGVIAGFTIFIGLPIGRVMRRSAVLVATLNAITIGVLVFLLWDVISHAVEPVEAALTSAAGGGGSWGTFAGEAAGFIAALGVGMFGLVAYDRWIESRSLRKQEANPAAQNDGSLLHLHDPANRLAFLIAVGIGLHNFSEGLAIGQSAASGRLSLAVILVIGFALHNATEGFGITAPLAGGTHRPSWAQLGVLGLIGGAPTLIGTLLGSVFVSDLTSIVFLALAAGSILYVVVQLVGVALKMGRKYRLFAGLLIGMTAGFATDFIITAAGA